jgi:bifunctional DNA-binding transcriptional regulator/antitoxin component of YhaV-PrlF toxin-antitoxin module
VDKSGLVTSFAVAVHPSRCRPQPPSAIPRDDPVTTLKLHYDGWLALPAALRRKLGLDKGATIELELVDGAIVLRPSAGGRGPAAGRGREAAEPPVDPASPALASARADTPAAREGPPDQALRPKRPRDRPRKAEVEPEPALPPGPGRAVGAAPQGGPAVSGV